MSYLLPTHTTGPDKPSSLTRIFLSRRYARFSALALFALLSFTLIHPLTTAEPWAFDLSSYPPYPIPRDSPPNAHTLPPLYERYTTFEDSLPQHDESLPFPEGSNAKFLYFANHAWGAGWGNIMQEMVLDAHLAYASGRTFVFDNYTWDRDGPEYSDYNGKTIPSRIPLSALLAGPIVGYPSPHTNAHPRAVSRHYYNHICPDPYILSSDTVKDTIPNDASALETLHIWTQKLQSIPYQCVEIKKDTPQLFDIWLFGSPRLHDILPTLMDSPIVRDFAWSPLINYAFQKNQHHFTWPVVNSVARPHRKRPLSSILFPYLFSRQNASRDDDRNADLGFRLPATLSTVQSRSLPLLALHLRRGDFMEHCDNLAGWGSGYTGYNTLPLLPDRFFVENATLKNEMSENEIKEAYREKCLVDVDKVRKRVIRAVKEWREERLKIERAKKRHYKFFERDETEEEEKRIKKMLRKVYIMTNGDRDFLEELKLALHTDAINSSSNNKTGKKSEMEYDFVWTWEEITTSRDLEWGWETKFVAQAMDMYVGQRAEVFVGNGFSSLTANVVLMRLVGGVEPWRTRFW